MVHLVFVIKLMIWKSPSNHLWIRSSNRLKHLRLRNEYICRFSQWLNGENTFLNAWFYSVGVIKNISLLTRRNEIIELLLRWPEGQARAAEWKPTTTLKHILEKLKNISNKWVYTKVVIFWPSSFNSNCRYSN